MRRIVAAAAAVGALLGLWKVRDRRKRDALIARQSAASADALAAEVRANIRDYGFALPDATQRFVREEGWTDASLLAALDAFHGDAMRHDERTGGPGREGEVFSFYDSGLATIGEVLAKRIASRR